MDGSLISHLLYNTSGTPLHQRVFAHIFSHAAVSVPPPLTTTEECNAAV